MNRKKSNKKSIIQMFILVIALVTLAMSGTYAYYTTFLEGNASTTSATSGKFYIESSLEKANAITNTRMQLIDEQDKDTKSSKLAFTVTNTKDSTVSGTYNVFLKDITITDNLLSKYFKWELVVGTGEVYNGDFASNSIVEDKNGKYFQLNANPIEIPKNTTQNLEFKIWLQNDEEVNQIELANGNFSGKLGIEAIPIITK